MVGSGERRRSYFNKMNVELAALTDAGVITAGNAFASVLLAKGILDNTELSGAPLFGGADGRALRAALLALGYAPEDWSGLATVKSDGHGLDAATLRQALYTFDPATLVICDDVAALSIQDCFADELADLENLDAALLSVGLVVTVGGIRMLNLGGFAAALSDNHEKQRMWAYLKQLQPLGEPY